MARDIICDVDHVEIAHWLVGDLRSGDQVGLCDEHFVAWSLAQVDTMLDEGQRLVAISKLAEKLPEPPAAEDGPPPEPKREVPPPRQRRPGRANREQAEADQAAALEALEQREEPPPEEVAGEAPAADDG